MAVTVALRTEAQNAVGTTCPVIAFTILKESMQSIAISTIRDVTDGHPLEKTVFGQQRESVVGAQPEIIPSVAKECPDDVVGDRRRNACVVTIACDIVLGTIGIKPVVSTDEEGTVCFQGEGFYRIAAKCLFLHDMSLPEGIESSLRTQPYTIPAAVAYHGVDKRLTT